MNSWDPCREGDYIVAEFWSADGGRMTVAGTLERLMPEGKPVWLRSDQGYFPLRSGVIVQHTTRHDPAYADLVATLDR